MGRSLFSFHPLIASISGAAALIFREENGIAAASNPLHGMGKNMSALVPRERIEQTILVIRGHRVMLDADLAKLYGVTTFNLNESCEEEC